MALLVQRLGPLHEIARFDCGDESLNAYLKRYAITNQERHTVGTTYVALSPSGEVIGYYTLATSSVPRADLPSDQTSGTPKYAQVPCLLLGRLAISRHHQRKGHGEELLRHCFVTALQVSTAAAAKYIITDAYVATVAWYKRYGFRELGAAGDKYQRMFLELSVIKKAIIRGCSA